MFLLTALIFAVCVCVPEVVSLQIVFICMYEQWHEYGQVFAFCLVAYYKFEAMEYRKYCTAIYRYIIIIFHVVPSALFFLMATQCRNIRYPRVSRLNPLAALNLVSSVPGVGRRVRVSNTACLSLAGQMVLYSVLLI